MQIGPPDIPAGLLSYSRPFTESSVLRRFQAPPKIVVSNVTRMLTCLLHSEMRRPGELFHSLSYSLRNGCILRVAVLSFYRLNPISFGETCRFSMVSAVTNSTLRRYLRWLVFGSSTCYLYALVASILSALISSLNWNRYYFMTCNPRVFKELFIFSSTMIALARRLSTKVRCAKKYRSAMQDMVSLSGIVLL
jgi:hypothetical protein